MNKKYRLPIWLLSILLFISSGIFIWADGGLLSPGASKITSDSSMNFCLNLGNLPEEMLDDGVEYVVSLMVSPKLSEMSVKENVGSLNPVNGEYQVNSTELGGINKLHFTISPDSKINKDTVYTVSVSVVGNTGSATDNFKFTAVSINSNSDAGDNKQLGILGNMKNNNRISMSGIATSNTESVIYAGSWDNYLEELSVTNYKFTRKFYKTRDTYFMTVPMNVSSIDVNATASDTSASVAIAGNDELTSGLNKVLIGVTADDGSIRYYRIYVNKSENKDTEDDDENTKN